MIAHQPGKDVILAEDDSDDVLVFELALKEVPVAVSVRHAKDGVVLFTLLEEALPELLFLDVDFPCKDGITCVREIRKNKAYDNLPVIMYTSNTSEKIVEQAFRGGANFYMTKTNTIRDLAKKLLSIFSIDWKNYMHYPPLSGFVIE